MPFFVIVCRWLCFHICTVNEYKEDSYEPLLRKNANH